MKQKLIAMFVVTAVLVLSLSAGAVFSPGPDGGYPPFFDVFVTNDSTAPVPVDVTDSTLNVNLDEPIEVTNPAGESLKTDVSGWLHTTQEGETDIIDIPPNSTETFFTLDTEGYRTVSVNILVWEGPITDFEIRAHAGGSLWVTLDTFSLPGGIFVGHFETYEVVSSRMMFVARTTSEGSQVVLWYYMTT